MQGKTLFLGMSPEVAVVLEEGAKMPEYAHNDPEFGDNCCDLFANETVTLMPGEVKLVKTGVHVAFPEGWCGKLHDRSGNSKHFSVRAGVIDAGYTGEICVRIVRNANWLDIIQLHIRELVGRLVSNEEWAEEARTKLSFTIGRGDKITQMEIKPFFQGKLLLTQELPDRTRGDKGFGSTGK